MFSRILINALVILATHTMPHRVDTTGQWALEYLRADSAWQLSLGSGVTVAVVDSGVSPAQSLGDRLLSGADFSQGTLHSNGDGQTDIDQDGHGSGMASLIAGSNNANGRTTGLAPGAFILPVRAYSTNTTALAFTLASSIRYSTSKRAQVVNLSVGGSDDEDSLRSAIEDALSHDIVIVAAVGNGGDSRQYYPAAYPGVLGVGAIDSSGKVWARSNTGADVGLVAPGVNIYRDDNRGRQGYSDGTSEATAYVSAAAALVRSAHPAWTAPEVVAALIETADKPAAMHGAVRTDEYGYGILDVVAALQLSAPPSVGGVGSPEPVKSSGDFGIAAKGSSRAGVGRVFAVVGGVVGAGLVGLGVLLWRRRGRVGGRG